MKTGTLFDLKNSRFMLQSQSLTRRLMIPLTALIIAVSVGIGFFIYHQQRHYLHDSFKASLSEFEYDQEKLLAEQTSALSLAIKTIASSPDLQKALKEKKSEVLLDQWQDVFQKMREENKVTHFYFLDPDRVCLLRVHNPSRKGDTINRFTALEAEWSRKTSSGVEVGMMGQFTLRVVEPIIVDNELIGYIELGKEIEDVYQKLHFHSEIEVAVALQKKYVKRDDWEEGMRFLGREPQWNMLSEHVIIYTSDPKIPRTLSKWMDRALMMQHIHNDLDTEVNVEGSTYRIAMTPFKDVSGKAVGDLFILHNVTNENIEFFNAVSIGVGAALGIVGILVGLIYLILRNGDTNIASQQRFLAESQERLEQLARHSRTFAWEVDNEGKYTYLSDVVYDVLGFRSDELIGNYFYDLHPEKGREEFKNGAFEVFKRKEGFMNLKNRAVSKEGNNVWLMTNGIPLIAPDGRLLGYRGNDTDITEWQNAEDSIIESRNLLDTIINTIPIRVFWKSKTLRYLGCNTLFAQDAGRQSPSEMIGKDDYAMGWAEQAELYRADDRAVMQSQEARLFYEEEQTTPEGDKIWLSTSKIPLKRDNGEIIGVLGVYEDITQRKETEKVLLENAKMLNEAQRFAKMGSWTLDLMSNSLNWSDEVYRIFEIDKEQFGATYEAFMDRIHPEDRDTVNNVYMASLASQQPYEVTHRLLMEEGRIKWVHESGISDFDPEGKPIRSMGTVQDITERKSAEDEIARLSFFDTLTQLPNRILLIDRLNQARVLSGRNGQFGSLLLIDLDNFKILNDTFGHVTGDILLQKTAQRLIASVREGDTIARWGGDEFVVLLNALGDDEKKAALATETIGKKILTLLNEAYDLDGISYKSTASMGITLFRGDEISSDELMKQADLAMYKSKNVGRNGFSFFDPEMETALKARAALEDDIRRGIEHEQFCLYFQPQISDGFTIMGAEVLVRWNHPQRGVVSPAEFIPVAEETGLIIPLGRWILQKGCEQIARWDSQDGFETFSVSINVSVKQFNQSNFVDEVTHILNESGADPKRLKLELTESLLVENIEEVVVKMDALRRLGLRFSLDDFGTGYSSLSYLKRLPLDQLKIDQGFVRDILSDPNDAIICKSTIALSQSMGLSVIAEGVETKEQLQMLRSFGCADYQGYYFSAPLPLVAFEVFQRDFGTLDFQRGNV